MSHRLTKQGRLRCAETGRANVIAWNQRSAARRREFAELAQQTREGLLRELGAPATRAQLVLIESCVTSVLALRALAGGFSLAKASFKALDRAVRVQGQLLRTLRALGLVRPSGADEAVEPEEEAEARSELQEYLARKVSDGKGDQL